MGSISTVLSVFILLLVGYGAKKIKLLKPSDAEVLNNVVLYVTLPAFIFEAVFSYKHALPAALAKVPLVGFGMIAVVLVVAYLIGKAIKLNNATMAGFIVAAAFGNTGFLGYPVVQAAFTHHGDTALLTAALYDEIAMALPLYTVGLILVAAFAGEKVSRGQIGRVLTFPQLWAIPAGLLFRMVDLPPAIISAMHFLANGTVPLVCISLGIMLSVKSVRGYGIPLTLLCLLKLLALPAITYFAGRASGISGVMQQSMVVEAGMPTAMMAGVLVAKFGENSEFMAGVIFITTLLSAVTIPATLVLLGVH